MKKMNDHPDLRGLDVLLVENDTLSLNTLKKELREKGAQVYIAHHPDKAKKILSQKHIHAIMASIDLIDEELIELVKDYKSGSPESHFYILTDQEYDLVETSHESVKFVVDDYIRKPLDIDRFTETINSTVGRSRTDSTSLTVIDPLIAKIKPYFLFRSPVMRRILSLVPKIADSDQTVLITGETGTGKEIIGRAIHMLSKNSSGPFVPLNCGAIPESLIEGELFGHEKGAFTGAIRTRRGKFESAENGTLFLDEIGDMQLNLQIRLLRVLEDKEVFRVGSEVPIPVNMRVVAASNVDLFKAVNDGLFREDLYYRLNVLRLHLPPLRERVEDIALLAVHFLERTCAEMKWQPPYPNLTLESIRLLEESPWRGNVRELRNLMTRVATLLPRNARQVFPFHVLPHLHAQESSYAVLHPEKYDDCGISLKAGMKLDDAEALLIEETLKKTNGNKSKAAALLGINVRTLRRKLNNPSTK